MLTDEDRAEVAMLFDAAMKADNETRGTELDKKFGAVMDAVKGCTDSVSSMQSRLAEMDQARRDADDIDKRIERIGTLARKTAADRARSTADAEDNLVADSMALTDAQVRADALAVNLGEKCPPPMSGESPTSYRKRLCKIFKRHSREFKDVDVDSMTPEVFRAAENQVYSDAAEVAARPPIVAPGRLLMREKKVDGHIIRDFHGSPSSWMNQFAGETGLAAEGRWLHDNLGNRN